MKSAAWIIFAAAVAGRHLLLAADPAAEEQSSLPRVPSEEEVQQQPEPQRLAARQSVKQVMLRRIIRLKAERRRLTPENSAACVALAAQLHAPAELVELLRLETAGPLGGRDLYEHSQALSKLVHAYGVDDLQIRLFVEGLNFTPQEWADIAEWLPTESVFNMVSRRSVTNEELEFQFTLLADLYSRLAAEYEEITNREQADAAAERLLGLLHSYDAVMPARLVLSGARGEAPSASATDSLLQPVIRQLVKQRQRLREADFFGSRRLAALDYIFG